MDNKNMTNTTTTSFPSDPNAAQASTKNTRNKLNAPSIYFLLGVLAGKALLSYNRGELLIKFPLAQRTLAVALQTIFGGSIVDRYDPKGQAYAKYRLRGRRELAKLKNKVLSSKHMLPASSLQRLEDFLSVMFPTPEEPSPTGDALRRLLVPGIVRASRPTDLDVGELRTTLGVSVAADQPAPAADPEGPASGT